MGKKNKTICLDDEIIEELDKTKSASKLINDLLKDYFMTGGDFKRTELINKISIKKLEIEKTKEELIQLTERLDKINNDDKRLKEIFKDIPKEIMDDFKFFDKMDLDSLMKRYNEVYKKRFDITYEEVKKAFCEIRGIYNA
jgi:DNA-binding transcriptional regulator GbsR (MarR family)